MILSDQAKKDLMEALQKQVGLDKARDFGDEEINQIGVLLLNVLAENLKMKVAGYLDGKAQEIMRKDYDYGKI